MEEAKREFLKFVKNFNQDEARVKLKISHTLRVVSLANKLAKKMKLSDEDQQLISLISLLHDIGRFYQLQVTSSFQDILFDHANYGVKFLFDEGHIRDYIADDTNDDIIKNAIYFHNKYVDDIPNLNERNMFFIKLIRDLDKLDILYTIYLNYKLKFKKEDVPDSYYEEFFLQKSIRIKGSPNGSKSFMTTCAYIYDFNFEESLELLSELKYLDLFFESIEVDNNSLALFERIKGNVYKKLKESIYVRKKI